MKFKNQKPFTPSQRHLVQLNTKHLIKKPLIKNKIKGLKKSSGRNNPSKVTLRHKKGYTNHSKKNIHTILILFISLILLIFTSPTYSLIWLCIPSIFFLYTLDFKGIAIIWVGTLFVWYFIFTMSLYDYKSIIIIGPGFSNTVKDYLVSTDLIFKNLCFESIDIFNELSLKFNRYICIYLHTHFIYLYKKIETSFIIFLVLSILVGLNMKKLYEKLSAFMLVFVLYLLYKNKNKQFFKFTVFSGCLLAKDISIYYSLGLSDTYFLTCVVVILTFPIGYGIIIGFFILVISYGEE